MVTRQTAKSELKLKGYTQRGAAPLLGIGYEQLNRVLNGKRESRRLLAKVMALPVKEVKAKESADK